MADAEDLAIMEQSLILLAEADDGTASDGLAAELFAQFIASHSQYAAAFINPAAAQERMTRETLEAMIGRAAGEYWVETTVVNFVDLHHNYGAFTAQDYHDWFTLVIDRMAARCGADWPPTANAAWQRQAAGLMQLVERELARR